MSLYSSHRTGHTDDWSYTNLLAPFMKDEKPGFGNYYSPMQVAEILGKDLFEVNRLVRRGILPAASINKHRWIPVKAVEDLVRSEQGPGRLTRLPEPQRMQGPQIDKPQNENTGKDVEVSVKPDLVAGKKATSSKEEGYYTVEEVADKLNKPSREIWLMVFSKELKVEVLEGERVFPKKAFEEFLKKRRIKEVKEPHSTNVSEVDAPAAGAGTKNEFHGTTVGEAVAAASAALGVDSEDIAYEVVDHGSKGFLGTGGRDARIKFVSASSSEPDTPSDETAATNNALQSTVDNVLRSGGNAAPARSQRRLTKGEEVAGASQTPSIEPSGDESRASADGFLEKEGISAQARAEISSREITKAAQRIGTSMNKVKQMVGEGKLIVDPNTGSLEEPAASTNDELSTTDRFVRAARHRALITEPADRHGISKDKVREKIAAHELVSDPETGRWVYPNQSSDQEEPEEKADPRTQVAPEAQRMKELEERVKDLQEELREEREENERLTIALDQEREEHEQDVRDAQYEVDRLDAELENIRRGKNNTDHGSRLKQERELREAAERWGRDLESQLDSEMVVRAERERWFDELESKLDEAEKARKELEHELSLERARIRQMVEEQRLLGEVRRLLGVTNEINETSMQDTEGSYSAGGFASNTSQAEDLLLGTPHGEWRFRPPFPLEQEEIALIQLVVGEDEITAEQIKTKKGRRSVEKLNVLLDRMLKEGIEPIKEDNDRYSFDPDSM